MNEYDPNFKPKLVYYQVGQKAVIIYKNKILMLKRSDKCSRPHGWDLAGGGLDEGEDPAFGMRREILEETGLGVKKIKPITIISSCDKDNVVIIGWQVEVLNCSVKLSWEHEECVWLSKDEALKLELPDVHRQIVEAVEIN